MQTLSFLAWLALTSVASATSAILHHRQADVGSNDLPVVPSYNFTMPVDHFDNNNEQTFNNRYFVNDTYYETGGPVIVYGQGEQGISDGFAARVFAEWNGTKTAVMELARELHGVVIGWEHRYYGNSLPVQMNGTAGLAVKDVLNGGLPMEGPGGYRYLGIEQAMEDLVYFANGFNQTTLNDNTVVASTENMDPYHTPWIYVGASYSGALAAFLRIRNPEIFYASWSSSGVVEARFDGSLMYNAIYRTLPSNCSADVVAVIRSFNEIILSGNQSEITRLKQLVYLTSSSSLADDYLDSWTPADLGFFLANWYRGAYQNLGADQFVLNFCGPMERFNGEAFLNNASSSSTNATIAWSAIASNPADSNPSDQGIVASSGDNSIRIGQAAYLYGFSKLQEVNLNLIFSNGVHSGEGGNPYVDDHSWTWQTLTEIGFFAGLNRTSNANMEIVMEAANVSAVRDYYIREAFAVYDPSVFPDQPDVAIPLKYGGWGMTPSNVMFTNGEADMWRPFTVMSAEQDNGAPNRTVTQTIPRCNEAPANSDVFGLLYGDGAGHAPDMILLSQDEGQYPLPQFYRQGVELFARAYNSWLPCFNQTRDGLRNEVDGSSNSDSNGAGSLRPSLGGLCATIIIAFFIVCGIM